MKSIWPLEEKESQVLEYLRQALNLSRDLVTDEDLLKATKGTLLLARIELGIELSRFHQALKASIGKE